MYQYTTPTLIIILNGIDFAHVDSFRIAINGKKNKILKIISGDDSAVDAENSTIRITLTQEESASLGKGYSEVQARIVTDDDEVFATNKVKTLIDSVYDEVVV